MHDVPWPLQDAINHALSIISWHENHTPDELPCENLWDDSEAVDAFFQAVQLRKDAEREGYRVSDNPEESDMTQNELASVFKR